ncbi:MAG: 50S ribosomal protein L29 [Acidobacteriota bacterium]|nr:50S ribosomal protein L29 [Acidobacteriota bacterium]
MKTSKLRDMSITELEDEASAHSEQLFKLRLQKATGQLDNAMKIRQIRRELAQVKTILGEKEMEEG